MASSSSSMPQKREVFLSFRGEDTRNNFTSHLYTALRGKAIDTFIDNNLKRGDEISTALLKTIEESMVSIVILSENYASSSWCLDELSKIIECKKTNGQVVVPIFYHVDPSDVRKQTGSFAEAFAKYEQRLTDKVERWRAALTELGNLAGWHLKKDRSEAEYIEEIIQCISKELIPKSSNDSKGLVGIDPCVEQVESLLCFTLEGVHIVGIWGMGGVGKTTIAEVVFNRFSTKFEGSCFLPNVREESEKHGLVHLQEKLLSMVLDERNLSISTRLLPNFIEDRLRRKRVLIVLDDVNDSRQLELLHGKYCFGPGSRIIVTSRDRQVLQQVVDKIFEVKVLINDEALKLFSLNAFKQNHPTDNFVELSNRVVNYAKGLPLALIVLGSALHRKSKQDWESALNKLKKIRNPEIHDLLRISYDGLDSELKDIFLDIACFFKGDDSDSVIEILDSCYESTSLGISVLIDKSLITISHKNLGLHDLLQEMGWNIVREESVKEPGKRSRLWIPEDVYHVLKNNTGTAALQAIFLDMSKIGKIHLSPTVFAKMYNLKLLKFYHSSFVRDRKVYLPQGLETLPDNLRYIQWDRYPSKSLPSNFCPENLVVLNMPNSHVERLWNGVQNFVKLKQLNLSHSPHLIEIPDLSRATNLERMEFDGCTSLVEVPSSIQYLYKLTFLCLWYCTNLRNLPSIIHLTYLKFLSLSHCSNITRWPEVSRSLEELYLTGTAIEEVSSTVGSLSRLKYLFLDNCGRLKTLPSSICKLKSLEILELSSCTEFERFPEILEHMQSLEKLHLRGTAIQELPSSIDHLDNLTLLNLEGCKKLKNLPTSIHKLKSIRSLFLSECSNFTKFPEISGDLVELFLSGTAVEQVPSSINRLSKLVTLDLKNCTKLESLPSNVCKLKSLRRLDLSGISKQSLPIFRTIPSLEIRSLEGTATKESYWSVEYLDRFVVTIVWSRNELASFYELLDYLGNLESLQDLCLSDCNLLEFPIRFTCKSSLRKLVLCRNNFERIPETIKQLSKLEWLDLRYCERLQSLSELPPYLKGLNLCCCSRLQSLPELPLHLEWLHLSYCERLQSLPELPPHLEWLHLSYCKRLQSIPELPPHLEWLHLSYCKRLQSIPELPPHLERLHISYCKRLQSIPEFPPHLQRLDVHDCTSLQALPSLFINSHINTFLFINCPNLDQNAIWAEAQLRILSKATEDVRLYHKEGYKKSSFTICLPGSEIPEWFSHQNERSFVTIPLSPHLDDSKFVGFFVCVVLRRMASDSTVICSIRQKVNYETDDDDVDVNEDEDEEDEDEDDDACVLCDSLKYLDSDHVLLGYDFDFYKTFCSKRFTQPTFDFFSNGVVIKKCGVCILYAQDDPTVFPPGCSYKDTSFSTVEPLPYNPRVIQPSSSSNGNFVAINRSVPPQPSESVTGTGSGSSPCDPTWLSLKCGVINQDSVEPMAEDGAIIKRCRADYHSEAEPSGSDEEEGEPHPKKSKFINFI